MQSEKDFASSADVRWCPGCGDYAILKAVRRTLAEIDAQSSDVVFVSGIGCASRFPYYMSSYGFHTIHGRAATVAFGVKVVAPHLSVWIVSGDGDSFSIGGNHLLHLLRRDENFQYLLFNNEIYGLTKGQVSPTSRLDTVSVSSPEGSNVPPVQVGQFVLSNGGSFYARVLDSDVEHLTEILKKAVHHRGTGFVEILQNCPVFNDGIFETAKENAFVVRHGEPLIWGDHGLVLDSTRLLLKWVPLNDVDSDKIFIHDKSNRQLARLLLDVEGVTVLGEIFAHERTQKKEAEGCHPVSRQDLMAVLYD